MICLPDFHEEHTVKGKPPMRRPTNHITDIAVEILRQLKRPATAKEIIDLAKNDTAYKPHIQGRTPQKTLNARIAIEILLLKDKSRFYRYAPATYGLTERLNDIDHDHNYKRVFVGNRRRKEVSNEPVATVKVADLEFMNFSGFYEADSHPIQLLNLLDIRYVDRKHAETCNTLKQLVSYSCICYEDQMLCFEKGRYTSDNGEFIGKQSVGFGGHINYYDLSLFDDSPVGFRSNVVRELYEELYFFRQHFRDNISEIKFVGFLVDSSTDNGKRHLGLAALVKMDRKIELESGALGFRNLRWLPIRETPNSFNRFEIWSQYLIRHIQKLYQAGG